MTMCSEPCGRFTLVGDATSLDVDADGRLVVFADRDYVVRVPDGLADLPLAGALTRFPGAAEAVLRFRGFIGDTRLDGREIRVRSTKLTADEVEEMLRSVAGQLASLPFAFATPIGGGYARDLTSGIDIAYQAFVLVRDAVDGHGRHDLQGALARVLGNPYTVLRPERAVLPLPLADRLGATTLLDAVTAGSLSASLPPGHPLAASPAAIAFGGRVPERLSVERVRPDADNVENRFVAGVLDACLRVVEQVARLARESKATGAPALERDCAVVRETLWVLRSHRVLEPLRGHGPAPLSSTVLQRQPGYREVLAFWMDLLARTRWLPSQATSALLALRDAPTLYEYWCFFAVVAAVERAEGPPVAFEPVKQDAKLARVAWAAQARFASGVEVVFNQHFAGHGLATAGPRSSSVPLRPDIVVRGTAAGFHVLDPKFRYARPRVGHTDDADGGTEAAAVQADIHKMHAYRDALGARSAWVLYPGVGRPIEFPAHDARAAEGAAPDGIGTIPLKPGAGALDGLDAVVRRMLA